MEKTDNNIIYDIKNFNQFSLFGFFLRKYYKDGRDLYFLFRKFIRETPDFSTRYEHPYFTHVSIFRTYCFVNGLKSKDTENLLKEWYTFLYEKTNFDNEEKENIRRIFL